MAFLKIIQNPRLSHSGTVLAGPGCNMVGMEQLLPRLVRWRKIRPATLGHLPLEQQAQILAASRTPLEEITDHYLRSRVRFLRHL